MWRDYLYFVTPDNYLVSLEAKTGKERWHKELASFQQQYFHTIAPVVIDNHVLVGSGNDLDMPGFLQSFDPETGELQWKWYATPQKAGDPGLETWKDTGRGPSTAAAIVGEWLVTIPRRGSTSSAPHHPPAYTSARASTAKPVHVRAGGDPRGYRQDGLVLPDVAHDTHDWILRRRRRSWWRHVRRPRAQAGADSGSQRLLLLGGTA